MSEIRRGKVLCQSHLLLGHIEGKPTGSLNLVIQMNHNYCNNGHNILRLFDVLPQFISTKHDVYQLPHELPNDLRLGT